MSRSAPAPDGSHPDRGRPGRSHRDRSAPDGLDAGGVVRPLRRDAARNRQLIIEAAADVLAEQGVRASMNDIASRAGVGVGTVYRRFPERTDLIKAVLEQRLAAVGRLMTAALEDEDPWRGLVSYLEGTIASEVADLGLSQLLDDPGLRAWVLGSADPVRADLDQLIARARDAGRLRPDVRLGDIALVKRMVVAIARLTRATDSDQWRRTLALALDGLAAGRAAGPLPGRPLAADERVDVMHVAFPQEG